MKIAVIKGDGVGKEVITSTLSVADKLIKKYKLPIYFEELPYGADHFLKTGISIENDVLLSLKQKYNAVLLGALGDPRVKNHKHARDLITGLRQKLDLYVNERPVKTISEDLSPLKNTDAKNKTNFVVFRENTEDIYSNIGGNLKQNSSNEVSIDCAVHTFHGVERFIKSAFGFAQRNGIKNITLSDKSNAMQYTGNLWQRVFWQIANQYKEIDCSHMFIDALCMDIIKSPGKYELIVTSNLFGDIITDLAAQIQGGMGMAASANYNPEDKNFYGVFEPVHGSAPDIAGKNIANPIGALLSFKLLLEKASYAETANDLDSAIHEVILNKIYTKDLGGGYSTTEITEKIKSEL